MKCLTFEIHEEEDEDDISRDPIKFTVAELKEYGIRSTEAEIEKALAGNISKSLRVKLEKLLDDEDLVVVLDRRGVSLLIAALCLIELPTKDTGLKQMMDDAKAKVPALKA